MKKAIILLLALALFAMPMAAKTTLVNVGYNIHNDYLGIDDLHLRSIGLSFSFLNGDQTGFYAQINPYYGLSFKAASVAKLADYDETLFGANFLAGYGGDMNFGSIGLLLGGGLFADVNNYSYSGGSTLLMSVGFGLAANFYFQPGAGNFVLNAGLTAALSPWSAWSSGGASDNYMDWGQSTINFNVGVGWRTGKGGSSGRRTSSSGSSGSSGGGDDDW